MDKETKKQKKFCKYCGVPKKGYPVYCPIKKEFRKRKDTCENFKERK